MNSLLKQSIALVQKYFAIATTKVYSFIALASHKIKKKQTLLNFSSYEITTVNQGREKQQQLLKGFNIS